MKRLLSLFAALVIAAPLMAQTPSVDGEVTKVDVAQAKLTLRHGEIKSLDMPPMTMSYRVANPKMLDRLAVGDKVRFAADKINGSYTITALVKAQ